jgi:hypothetical protein
MATREVKTFAEPQHVQCDPAVADSRDVFQKPSMVANIKDRGWSSITCISNFGQRRSL